MAALGSRGKRQVDAAGDSSSRRRRRFSADDPADLFVVVLADADCTVLGCDVAILGSGDVWRLQMQLEQSLGGDSELRGKFLSGLQAHIDEELNLRRLLKPISISASDGGFVRESVARILLTVSCIQPQVASVLLEKLPEYFSHNDSMTPLADNVPRMILAQFRWLDYLVDSSSVTQKMLEILSISPLNLKKEIISFLPEVVSDAEHATVLTSLEQMLQEDLQILVPVLDALSNLNLEKCLYQQLVDLALTNLRSADAEDLPSLVRFLLQSATPENARRIVHHLRENLNFVTYSDACSSKPPINKLKGKSSAENCEALVLDAFRSGLRFQNVISEEFLKEIKCVHKERRHKVLDIWLLLVLHANGGLHQKSADSLLKRKALNREISSALLRQSIKGHGSSLQHYFQDLISVAGLMLRSKERLCLQFGMQLYVLLFEEFSDTYHRQEILGSLITHTGTGIPDEVSTALKTLDVLSETCPYEMLPMSSFINVILDYIETFPSESLHQVYKIFSHLATACWSSGSATNHSSVGDDLLVFIRKQVANSELKYKRMGIIGVVNLMSCLRAENVQELANEAVGLLQMTLDMCKTSCVARGFFYDELAMHIETQSTHVSILDWSSKHTTEFESTFLGDLEGGQVTSNRSEQLCEGELWMNLDGEASPVFLNLLPMVASQDQSILNSLLFLLSNFRLLAATERSVNQGSMGSIDALLGCPMYLPKASVLCGSSWVKLSKKQKELSCIAMFFAMNWIKELINAFTADASTSTLEDETCEKLISRLRHLLLLEQILADCLKAVPHLVLPQLHCFCSSQSSEVTSLEPELDSTWPKRNKKRRAEGGNPKPGKASQCSQDSQAGGKLRQRKTDGRNSQEPRSQSQNANPVEESTSKIVEENSIKANSEDPLSIISIDSLGSQQWKLRPLNLSSLNLLAASQFVKLSCCSDPDGKLAIYLYLMQDLLYKLESCFKKSSAALRAIKPSSGLGNLSSTDLLLKTCKWLPSIRSHLDTAVAILKESEESADCSKHWSSASRNAGTPCFDFSPSRSHTAKSFLHVTFRCLGKILQFPEAKTNEVLLKELLAAFGTQENLQQAFPDLQLDASFGSLDYLSCSTYAYLDGLFNAAAGVSNPLATELIMLLNYLVECLEVYNEESSGDLSPEVLTCLSQKLSASASRLLDYEWSAEEQGKLWKPDVLKKLLRMMIQQSRSPIEMLENLSSNIMTQVPSKAGKFSIPGYPALGPTTFLIWYRVQHEVVFDQFSKLVKKILACSKSVTNDAANLLDSAFKCVSIHVSLVNFTRIHDKTSVHAVALRYGGKFVDTFLKSLVFLEAHYDTHKAVINNMVKEMQKATRTIQSICSEGKGQKKMPLTSKVPAVKRSMERYVFCIKALLHKASNGTAFWMGNLKHKDLQGNEIGSQIPVEDECEDEEDDNAEVQEDEEPNAENDISQQDISLDEDT